MVSSLPPHYERIKSLTVITSKRNVILWHCQGALCHIHPELVREATSPTFKYTLVEHPGCIWFEVKLAATDSCGRTNYASHFVRVASRDAACAA
jgi:hypothetical protein